MSERINNKPAVRGTDTLEHHCNFSVHTLGSNEVVYQDFKHQQHRSERNP
jgi:hypothetical protein